MPEHGAQDCPACGAPLRSTAAPGKLFTCPTCGKKVRVPATDDTLCTPQADAVADTLLAPAVGRSVRSPDVGRTVSSPHVPGYEILDELGRGGMGVVYKVRHIGLNRVVALKMILSAEHAGKEAVARFKAEAEAVAQLKHPNIIQVYDIGEQDGRPFFSMEFVEGGSLQSRIGGQPQPPKWCAEIAEKLAQAMHVAHSQGIVHRDLKPANVLLVGQAVSLPSPSQAVSLPQAGQPAPQEPKIMDFGLAKRVESGEALTQSGAVMGTPQYMAPEQASGEARRVGPPADVYALGAILYTMLTGKPPFSAETALGVLRKVLNDEPAPPTTLHKRIPPDLETICLKCLQKEPQKRYASAQELAADLRRFLNSEPIVARPSGSLERATKWAKRRPAAATLIGVSAVALVALISGGVWYNAQLNAALRRAQDEATEKEKQRRNAEAAQQAEAQQRELAEKRLHEIESRKAETVAGQAVFAELLPAKIPQLPGYDMSSMYVSAKELCGNYHAFIPVGDIEHLALCEMAVSDKGIPGALVVSSTAAILRTMAANNLSAADVLARTNFHVARDIKAGMSVACLYAILNVRTREMSVASAGHHPLLLWRSATRTVETVGTEGIALGLDKGPVFNKAIKEQKVRLSQGDRVLMCTSGVVEQVNEKQTAWGEDNLVRFLQEHAELPSEDFVRSLVRVLAEHRGNSEQTCDITVVTFRLTSEGPPAPNKTAQPPATGTKQRER